MGIELQKPEREVIELSTEEEYLYQNEKHPLPDISPELLQMKFPKKPIQKVIVQIPPRETTEEFCSKTS
jgi:hypothetical protein